MRADIVVEDKNEVPFLFVEVKTKSASRENFWRFVEQLNSAPSSFLYGMLVDPETMIVLRKDLEHPEPIVELKTKDVLSHYAPDYTDISSRPGSRGILHDYLETLVGSWLRDLASHWKSESPPGTEELSRSDLMDRLEGGMTRSEVALHGDPLS